MRTKLISLVSALMLSGCVPAPPCVSVLPARPSFLLEKDKGTPMTEKMDKALDSAQTGSKTSP